MDEVKYGVIHEVGEYQDVKPLSDEDNKFILGNKRLTLDDVEKLGIKVYRKEMK